MIGLETERLLGLLKQYLKRTLQGEVGFLPTKNKRALGYSLWDYLKIPKN